MKTHELKTDPQVFDAVASGRKTFEIRYDDRGYDIGDTLILRRTRYTGDEMRVGMPLEYTGETETRTVSHILRGPTYGLQRGWVILSLRAVIEDMVDRFLGWPLPDSVCSDLCVTQRGYQFPRAGTCLLDANEARQMFEYVFLPNETVLAPMPARQKHENEI